MKGRWFLKIKNIIFKNLIFLFVTTCIFVFYYFDKISFKLGDMLYKNGFFQNAACCYNLCLNYSKFSKKYINYFKNIPDKFIDKLYFSIANCYVESGNIHQVINFYLKILNEYNNLSIENEYFINYLKMEIAENYSKLGYFDKALPIYKELQDWYPQNLINLYINMKDYYNVKNILFSEQIIETIQNGDDIDSASLYFLLLKFYLELRQYQKIFELTHNNIEDFEK